MAAFLISWVLIRWDANAWWILLPSSLLGVGYSFLWGTSSATTMRDIDTSRMGAASGVYNSSRQIGSVMGVSFVSAALQVEVTRASLQTGSANALLLIVVVMLAGLVAVSFFKDTLHAQR